MGSVLRTISALRLLPQGVVRTPLAVRSFTSPVLGSQDAKPASPVVTLGAPLSQRNAGVSVLGCAIAMVAVGGCAQGIGQLFAAKVVGLISILTLDSLLIW